MIARRTRDAVDRSSFSSASSASASSSASTNIAHAAATRSGIPNAPSLRSSSPAPTARDRSPRWSMTALRAAGHRSGRYTSPAPDRLEERFVIDGTRSRRRSLEAARRRRVRDGRRKRWSRRHARRRCRRSSSATTAVGVRAVPATHGVDDRGARSRPRRPARRHQHRHRRSPPRSCRSISITRRSSGTRSRRSPPRRPASSRPGVPVVVRPAAGRGARA